MTHSGYALPVVLLLALVLLSALSSTGWVIWRSAQQHSLAPLLGQAYWASRSGVEAAQARWRLSLAQAIPAWQHLQLPTAPLEEVQTLLTRLALDFCGLETTANSLADLRERSSGSRGLTPTEVQQGYICKRIPTVSAAQAYTLFQAYLPAAWRKPDSFWEALLGQLQQREITLWSGPPSISLTSREGMAAPGVRVNPTGTTFHWMLGPQPLEVVATVQSGSQLPAHHRLMQQFRPLELRLSALVPSGLLLASGRLGWERDYPLALTSQVLLAGKVYLGEHLALAPNPNGSPASPWFGGEVASAGCEQAFPQGCGQQAPFFYLYTPTDPSPQRIYPNARQTWCTPSYCPEFVAGPPHLRAQPLPLPNPITRFRDQAEQTGLILGRGPSAGLRGQVLDLQIALQALTANGNLPARPEWLAAQATWKPDALTIQWIEATTDRLWRNDPQLGRLAYQEHLQFRYTATGQAEQRTWIEPLPPTPLAELKADPDYAARLAEPPWQALNRAFSGQIWLDHPSSLTATLSGGTRAAGLPDAAGRSLSLTDPRTARPSLAPFARITLGAASSLQLLTDLTLAVPACSGFPQRAEGAVPPIPCLPTAPNQIGLYLGAGSLSLPDLASPTLMGLIYLPQGSLEQTAHCLRGELRLIGSLLIGRLAPTAPGCPPPAIRMVHDPRLSQAPGTPPGLDWLALPVWVPQVCLGPAPLDGTCLTPSPQEWLLPAYGRSQ